MHLRLLFSKSEDNKKLLALSTKMASMQEKVTNTCFSKIHSIFFQCGLWSKNFFEKLITYSIVLRMQFSNRAHTDAWWKSSEHQYALIED